MKKLHSSQLWTQFSTNLNKFKNTQYQSSNNTSLNCKLAYDVKFSLPNCECAVYNSTTGTDIVRRKQFSHSLGFSIVLYSYRISQFYSIIVQFYGDFYIKMGALKANL